MKLGAVDYISKPFAPKDLVAAAERILKQHCAGVEARASKPRAKVVTFANAAAAALTARHVCRSVLELRTSAMSNRAKAVQLPSWHWMSQSTLIASSPRELQCRVPPRTPAPL